MRRNREAGRWRVLRDKEKGERQIEKEKGREGRKRLALREGEIVNGGNGGGGGGGGRYIQRQRDTA